ncbi:hypothetical protein LTR74_018713, partial [Friedmanniomyces endolithicus]
TIICPDDLIATTAALTLAIRVIGDSIGYCVYYNVFISKFVPAAIYYIGGAMELKLNITNPDVIKEAIGIIGTSLLPLLDELTGIKGLPGAHDLVVLAGQMAYAEAYKYVYYVSIAFGGVSIIAAFFLGDISKYMDDHVAVVMHQIGLGLWFQTSRALVNIRERSRWKIFLGRQGWITAVECISGAGFAGPPHIFCDAIHTNIAFIQPDTPDDWYLSTSKSGWDIGQPRIGMVTKLL